MRAMALDVGAKTIGVALSDPEHRFASSLGVLERKGEVHDVAAVARMTTEHDAGHVVIGLPLELDGRKGRRARRVCRFAEALTAHYDRASSAAGTTAPRIEAWDERFSTAAAERTLLEADVSRGKRRKLVDALAAQFILQGWLDARRLASAEESEL